MITVTPPQCSTEPRVLLHSCCAPCSGAILECLVASGIRPLVFFSNSNIVPQEEYALRRAELERYCRGLGLETVDDDYDHGAWLECVKGLEHEPERGGRCTRCFEFRLRRAAEYALEHGYNVIATTLASSRWKNLEQVDAAGAKVCTELAAESGKELVWWERNWRKGGLQPRRGEIIREQGFYNQNYCGCEFSRSGEE